MKEVAGDLVRQASKAQGDNDEGVTPKHDSTSLDAVVVVTWWGGRRVAYPAPTAIYCQKEEDD
jgi:hypothetical protein